MKQAPPILGALEFAGMYNKLIIVEHDDDDDINLLGKILHKKVNIIFSPSEPCPTFDGTFSAIVLVHTIARIHKIIKTLSKVDTIVIDRIDLMDADFSRKEKGAQTKAFLSMLNNERTLKGANLVVTSCRSEYMIREIADKYISLRK